MIASTTFKGFYSGMFGYKLQQCKRVDLKKQIYFYSG